MSWASRVVGAVGAAAAAAGGTAGEEEASPLDAESIAMSMSPTKRDNGREEAGISTGKWEGKTPTTV